MTYEEFLKSKEIAFKPDGFDVGDEKLNEYAYQWQEDIVKWALRKGKAALFEDCGLGKTIQLLIWSEQVIKHTKKPVIVFSPLAVAYQTKREGDKFNIPAKVVRSQYEIDEKIPNITNYEIIDHFDLSHFGGIVLDESSILKDYTSKTKNDLIKKCKGIPFKLCCTATPCPNDTAELGNHAEFLGVMSRTEMLSTFFVHDGGDTSKWRLKGHAKEKFFAWVASWACCMTSPADLGYDASEYNLPPLKIIEHIVKSDVMENSEGQFTLIAPQIQTLNDRRAARRGSLEDRCAVASELCRNTGGQVVVWCDLNAEGDELRRVIPDGVEVRGSDDPEYKVNTLRGFTDGDVRVLISKSKIAGWGMNWQNCSEVVFVGLSDSFEAYYQAVRRCWRFGQKNPVNVHIIISEGEGAVKQNIERKQKETETLTKQLIGYTQEILKRDVKKTVRMTDLFYATEQAIIPDWLVAS